MTMSHSIGKCTATFVLYFAFIALFHPVFAEKGLDLEATAKGEFGSDAKLDCSVSPETADLYWMFQGQNISQSNETQLVTEEKELNEKDLDGGPKKKKILHLTIKNAIDENAGNYTCVAAREEQVVNKTVFLDLSFKGRLVNTTQLQRLNVSKPSDKHVKMECLFEVYKKPDTVRWYKMDDADKIKISYIKIDNKDQDKKNKLIKSTHHLELTIDANGTYVCEIDDEVTKKKIQGKIDLIVLAKPKIISFVAIPVNTTEIYLKWEVNTYNSPIISYNLFFREGPQSKNLGFTQYAVDKIPPENTSFVVSHQLKKSTEYQFKLEVNAKGWLSTVWINPNFVKTLDEEPVFIPNITIKGFSATSVTIGWLPPPEGIADLIHFYILEARKEHENKTHDAVHARDSRNLPYMFGHLDPHSTYVFRVRACSDYTKRCGPWSEEMQAATLDGIPGKPSNVHVNCDGGYMNITWDPPEKPNAEIKGYTMELTGNATFKDRYGTLKEEMWGPLSRFTANNTRSARFDELRPNSNYTVRLSAMTRTRRRGDEETRHCRTKPREPDAAPRPRWRKILENNRYMFKMYLPRITERNGPICCYRVHMVRMLPNINWKNLPTPKDMNVIEYGDAHAVQPILGAYITDIFSNDKFPSESELIMGDGNSYFDRKDPTLNKKECRRCLLKPSKIPPEFIPVPTTSTSTIISILTTEDDLLDDDTTADPEPEKVEKTRRSLDRDYSINPMMRNDTNDDERMRDNEINPNDGPLDSMSNYTLFVEVIPGQPELESLYSEYVKALMPAPSPPAQVPSSMMEIALQVTCAVAAVVLLIMIAFCIFQARRSRKVPPHAPLEMNRIQAVCRYFMGQLGGRSSPPDMPPIPRDQLAAAYAERQADSDYGFQKEFEMLPECFTDRTTHASEARENQPKNRYPDIKAYDQTRVMLSQIDSITGSDYINANYVTGYKERKQFICAQGPTDTTVNDFWRMIWEHGLELIVMLTNLEEYSKVKCSKYWPDEVRGSRAFGAVTVHHVSEKRYSDYIVRELRITKQPTNSEGQPIVENNGVAKRNGDCKEPSESSAPTSPREVKESEGRIVRQYHFLMWKDFAAPEHPHSILKFIKRVNEAWSNVIGPVVVHCSAGVGRTGTLVALDCLLEQLRATGQVAVFNTVAELRRQRNFLVQSLKQYVFVYRALVEYAHYGDTEIPASRLKASIDRLRNTPEGGDKCLMEHEFEKMMNNPVAEPVKSCAAGASEEVRAKNRSNDCLPYDRNRVILTPLPGKDFSTYINASFIEAYDNSEGFIITQDPLPNTIADFWRMVSEHNVSTIVMLSELGEGKCPRYWDDGSAQYDHMSVQYEESDSCPYYTRRQFRVTNNKNGDTITVRQLQYQGWPTAPGHVPEVTRGLGELADAARAHQSPAPPMLVHCHVGTERSALFVALCILICQLRVERRVDVNAVARKVRSQRARTIDTFLQYEFLHRAILNYAELHNLLEDS